MKSASDIWDTLKRRFFQSDDARVCNLQFTLSNISQGTRSVDEYFSELNGVWEELRNFRPMPHCSCGECNREHFQKYVQQCQKDNVFKFLNGLNESYAGLRSQIVMIKPFPSLDEAYNLILREKSQRSIHIQSQPFIQTSAMASTYVDGKKKNRNDLSCSHCGKNGHTRDKCYKLIGFPPDFKFTEGKNNPRKSINNVVQHSHTKQGEHDTVSTMSQLSLIKNQVQILMTTLNENGGTSIDDDSSTSNSEQLKASLVNFTIVSLISNSVNYMDQNARVNNSSKIISSIIKSNSWIIDTSASDHITCSLSFLTQAKPIHNAFVQMPDNSRALVSHIGTVKITPSLTLKNVLYVPLFRFSLISVSKLIENEQNCLIFTNFRYIIQEIKSWTMIGLAKMEAGLYFLQGKPQSNDSVQTDLTQAMKNVSRYASEQFSPISLDYSSNFFVEQFDIWHLRLGHAPPSIIKQIQKTLQQNGAVERKHQHLLTVARSLMFQASLPLKFWGDFVLIAAHTINRMPFPILQNKSPYEMLFNKKPDYSHFRVFGSLCFASTLVHQRKKFDHRARKCIMIGYLVGIKGYRLYDLQTHNVFVSKNVNFFEHIFPFKNVDSAPNSHEYIQFFSKIKFGSYIPFPISYSESSGYMDYDTSIHFQFNASISDRHVHHTSPMHFDHITQQIGSASNDTVVDNHQITVYNHYANMDQNALAQLITILSYDPTSSLDSNHPSSQRRSTRPK
ncbi:Retrotransposon gag domain - like 10 [Theobroma cacao]|nr:Retrotransposon gag domain - like 10 [Theobroma cacao]